MWHASAGRVPSRESEQAAVDMLGGVGDADLGEWLERGAGGIVHVRRRLSDQEAELVGMVRDVRCTREADRRYREIIAAAGFDRSAAAALLETGRRMGELADACDRSSANG